MGIASVTTSQQLRQVYDKVLAPTFPVSELGTYPEIEQGWQDGHLLAWMSVEEDGDITGSAICGISPNARTALLAYLALAPGKRGGGIGSALYRHVTSLVAEGGDIDVMLGEFEHPDMHTGSESAGDPTARLRFYDRHGAVALALPYFQPGIAGQPRIPGFILGLLSANDKVRHGTDIDSAPIKAFLEENLLYNEGKITNDHATSALLQAANGPVVSTIELSRTDIIPICRKA